MGKEQKRGCSEKGKGRVDYPTNLDVVDIEINGGREYQIVGMVQTENSDEDMFIVKDIESGETKRLIGSCFERKRLSKEPGPGDVHRRDEGVRNTGSLKGGKFEKEDPQK